MCFDIDIIDIKIQGTVVCLDFSKVYLCAGV